MNRSFLQKSVMHKYTFTYNSIVMTTGLPKSLVDLCLPSYHMGTDLFGKEPLRLQHILQAEGGLRETL